jgi:hypothetical protein
VGVEINPETTRLIRVLRIGHEYGSYAANLCLGHRGLATAGWRCSEREDEESVKWLGSSNYGAKEASFGGN